MIRIRPGRSWRLNPGYLGQLRALSRPKARSFRGAGILDVLGIEIDGVDVAAGIGEAHVLVAVHELAEALLRLGDGAPAAEATVGPGPTQAVLEVRGADALLTLVTIASPGRVIAGGLLLPLPRLRAAVLAASRGLLQDLLAISPALAEAPVAVGLARASERLSAHPRRTPREWPRAAAPALLVRQTVGGATCTLQTSPETAARIAVRAAAPHAPLAALLGPATLALRLPAAPAVSCELPFGLALRGLVRQAEALLAAREAGETQVELALGPLRLDCNLEEGTVRAPGFGAPAPVRAEELAAALAGAARRAAHKALKLAPAEPVSTARGMAERRVTERRAAERRAATGHAAGADELLREARDDGAHVLRRCRELLAGELHRPPAIAHAEPAPERAGAPPRPDGQTAGIPQFGRGGLRRLVYRELWRAAVGPADLAFVPGAPSAVLLSTPQALAARELLTGRPLWQCPATAWAAAPAGELSPDGDLVVADPEGGVARIQASTGEIRWRRRLAGAGAARRLWADARGIYRPLPGEGLALLAPSGALSYRVRLGGGAAEQVLLSAGVLVVATEGGMIHGLDPSTGVGLWRSASGGRVLSALSVDERVIFTLGPGRGRTRKPRVLALDPLTGRSAWERPLAPLPGGIDSRTAALGGSVLLLESSASGTSVLGLRAREGTVVFQIPLPWAGASSLVLAAPEEDGTQGGDALVLLAGPSGALLALDGRGVRRWSVAAAGDELPGPTSHQRGLLLGTRGALRLREMARGTLLAEVPLAAQVHAIATGPELELLVLSEDGTLSAQRLATHLSLV